VDILAKIMEVKRTRLSVSKSSVAFEELRDRAVGVRSRIKPHRLFSALSNDQRINIIAEFKRRSPSKGEIKTNADPASFAKAYESAGAAAVSVLTEEDHFHGSLDDLEAVRRAISLPILRKDFIFEEYQLYESAAAGADALLLIAAALDDETLGRLRRITEEELGMDALVEVHTTAEMGRAIRAGAKLIGVNNRDLGTFEVSLETSVNLAAMAPNGVVLISESGIGSAADIKRLRSLGYCGFLIGETLMRAQNPAETLMVFTQRPERAKVGPS
jgi:indole-3-glycerol phosphate synthase